MCVYRTPLPNGSDQRNTGCNDIDHLLRQPRRDNIWFVLCLSVSESCLSWENIIDIVNRKLEGHSGCSACTVYIMYNYVLPAISWMLCRGLEKAWEVEEQLSFLWPNGAMDMVLHTVTCLSLHKHRASVAAMLCSREIEREKEGEITNPSLNKLIQSTILLLYNIVLLITWSF